jgi:hypothetical protein
MERWITTVILSSAAMMRAGDAQPLPAPAESTSAAPTKTAVPSDIPPIPRGRSTIFGGEIRELDPVRDQLTLRVFGDRPMKILFDERTQVYRDGKRISVRDLRPEQQASVQTTLDGTKVFALSIHMLTRPEQGEYQGRVLSFDRGSGELKVASGLSSETVKVRVDSATALKREGPSSFAAGQAGFGDLREGSLVSLEFRAAGKDVPAATKVTVLAIPGSEFVFSGNVTSLDVHAGSLVLVDPRDQRSYQVFFKPSTFSAAQNLHLGDNIRVTANYDGMRYMANEVSPM